MRISASARKHMAAGRQGKMPIGGSKEGLALRLFSGESHSSRFCRLSDQLRPCPGSSDLPGLRLLRSRLRLCAASGLRLLRSLSRRRAFLWRLCLLCLSPCFCADLVGIRSRQSCAP